MNADLIDTHLVAYLSLREARGVQMRAEDVLLPEFVAFVKAPGIPGPIRTQIALAWARQVSTHRGASGAARRLRIARGVLLYLQASAPDTEVPPPGLLPAPRRPTPDLFTPTQLTALSEAAHASRPRGALRPPTFSTPIGLLARTGLRVGEAIRLRIEHVQPALPPPLHILETKFHKSRIVPLHSSTAAHLRHYREQRARLHCAGLPEAFFVSERGPPLPYLALRHWFARLCQRAAIAPTTGGRSPCLMSFRHTSAVTCLQRWYQQGLDVPALLPHRSVSRGRVHPHESCGYLTAVPELLGAAAPRFQADAHAGGDADA